MSDLDSSVSDDEHQMLAITLPVKRRLLRIQTRRTLFSLLTNVLYSGLEKLAKSPKLVFRPSTKRPGREFIATFSNRVGVPCLV